MNKAESPAKATTSHVYSNPNNDWFIRLRQFRERVFGRDATVQDAVAQIGKLRDQIADGYSPVQTEELDQRIKDYLIAHCSDIKNTMHIASNASGEWYPYFLLDSLQRLAADICPDTPGAKRRLKRTQWLNLGCDTSTFSQRIQTIVNKELVRCRSYDNPKSCKWIPVVMQINYHFMAMMMRWTGTSLLFVLPGTLGNTIFLDRNSPITRPADSVRCDNEVFILMNLLCSDGHAVCQEHFTAFLRKKVQEISQQEKKSSEFLQTLTQSFNSLRNPHIQILILEPGRQKDLISCGIIALHDLFVFINDGGMRGIKGKQVYFAHPVSTQDDSKDKTKSVTLHPRNVPACELYKMTAYPPDLLRPSQSLSTFKKEIEKLKEVSETHREKAQATEAHISKWKRPSSSKPEQSHELNLFTSYYTLDATMHFSGVESSIKNIGRPS